MAWINVWRGCWRYFGGAELLLRGSSELWTFCSRLYSASNWRCISKSNSRSLLTRCRSISRTTPWCITFIRSCWLAGNNERADADEDWGEQIDKAQLTSFSCLCLKWTHAIIPQVKVHVVARATLDAWDMASVVCNEIFFFFLLLWWWIALRARLRWRYKESDLMA